MNDSFPVMKIFGKIIGITNSNQIQEAPVNNKIKGISNQENNYKKYHTMTKAEPKNQPNNKAIQGGRTHHGVQSTNYQITNLISTSKTTDNILKFTREPTPRKENSPIYKMIKLHPCNIKQIILSNILSSYNNIHKPNQEVHAYPTNNYSPKNKNEIKYKQYRIKETKTKKKTKTNKKYNKKNKNKENTKNNKVTSEIHNRNELKNTQTLIKSPNNTDDQPPAVTEKKETELPNKYNYGIHKMMKTYSCTKQTIFQI